MHSISTPQPPPSQEKSFTLGNHAHKLDTPQIGRQNLLQKTREKKRRRRCGKQQHALRTPKLLRAKRKQEGMDNGRDEERAD